MVDIYLLFSFRTSKKVNCLCIDDHMFPNYSKILRGYKMAQEVLIGTFYLIYSSPDLI